MSNLLTEKQLCDVLHVGRVFLYMCRDRGMPYVRLGAKLVRYDYYSFNLKRAKRQEGDFENDHPASR